VAGGRRAEDKDASGGIVLTGLPFQGSVRVGRKGTRWN
jgi:hypothetical protein